MKQCITGCWQRLFLVVGILLFAFRLSASPDEILIVSHYTDNIAPYAQLAAINHRQYADRHGYSYKIYNGLLTNMFFDETAETSFKRLGYYWQKVEVVDRALLEKNKQGKLRYQWVLWVDSDALFTNMDTKIEQLIERYGNVNGVIKHLIMAKDESDAVQHIKINDGVFLLRNSEWSRGLISQVGQLFSAYKDCGTHEQNAFQDVIFNAVSSHNCYWQERAVKYWLGYFELRRVIPEVALIRQRDINGFMRPDYDDPDVAKWHEGDFVAHFSGMDVEQRRAKMLEMIEHLSKLKE